MRKFEFSELKIKESYNEESFYKYYLKTLTEEIQKEQRFEMPEKKYEIFYLNILGGKILLLDKNYLPKTDIDNRDLFYEYKIAYKVYNHWLDIYDGIENEQFEFNELYKAERLEKDLEIQKLKVEDNEIFCNAINEYNIIKKSQIYTEYLRLLEENKVLKENNNILIEKVSNTKNENKGFWWKIISKIRTKKSLNSGETK